jgi:hypothetical protein
MFHSQSFFGHGVLLRDAAKMMQKRNRKLTIKLLFSQVSVISLQMPTTLMSRRDLLLKLKEKERKLKQQSSPKEISQQIPSGLTALGSLLTEVL